MRIGYVLVAILFFVIGLVVGFFVGGFSITGEVVFSDEYSYTRALCSENECIDVVVFCDGGKVVEIEPIFYLVEHEDGWEDFRDVGDFCD